METKMKTRNDHLLDMSAFHSRLVLRGRLLLRTYGTEAEYRSKGDEGYVRAVVKCSDGTRAWTQPVFVA